MTDLGGLETQINNDLDTLTIVELKKKYLTQKGLLTKKFANIKNIPNDKKSEFGKTINRLKTLIEEKINNSKVKNKIKRSLRIDPTAPFDCNTKTNKQPHILDLKGSSHILMQEVDTFIDIFKSMGFDIVECRQVDDDYHMFESLNFPKGHPARDMFDTFWTEDGFVLPAHTSTMQNRILSNKTPPIYAVIPGRVYRNEATDASHEHTLFQCEGIYVDKDISVANMIATITEFLETYLESKLEVKIQPAYFPFTEPDCEFSISCPFCDKNGCSICGYTGWIELMGCGMIHPNVLRFANIDPDEYSGFAWGFGVDRLVMIKNNIPEIRHLRAGSIKFLREY
ncbi:TPA: phenylalanine--tRNA ligase subunit alpha [Patescibacteria group bacterium]|nr:phenylalanine--tRNA ligase subunit alpha [Patescibacteria group bacterium]